MGVLVEECAGRGKLPPVPCVIVGVGGSAWIVDRRSWIVEVRGLRGLFPHIEGFTPSLLFFICHTFLSKFSWQG